MCKNSIDKITCPIGEGGYLRVLEDVLKQYGGEEVDAFTVYKDIFFIGRGMIQRENEPPGQHKANPLGYYRRKGEEKGHYRILFEDTFEKTLKELQAADFCIVNGLSYFGRKNVQERASKMYAMIFDIDGVTDSGLKNLLNGGFNEQYDIYPLPNYVVLSGRGVHFYYLFEQPIPLFPYIKLQLKALKYALTSRLWNQYTSMEEKPQYQGINQGFRVIGGKSKIEGVRVRAFRISGKRQTLSNMGRFVPEENRVDERKLYKESKMTLDEARKKWPEWYQAVVVEKRPRRYWEIKRDLYDWWKRQISDGATYHHRYFSIMCLAIYAAKCNISKEELEKDALQFVPFLHGINVDEPFTVDDVKSALECYDKKYCTFPIFDIEKISGISIKRNKRNGRKQADHLRRTRAVQMVDYPSGEWRNKEGRPTKARIVAEWRKSHREGKKIDCERETGLSRHTILKWWNCPIE